METGVTERWFIRKLDVRRREQARWKARLRMRYRHLWLFETEFPGPRWCVAGFCFHPGDRMLEAYFDHRWFNIYEVYEGHDGPLRGWYVNLSFPARLEGPNMLGFIDLALDLVVFPHGEMVEVDWEEFLALGLPEALYRLAMEDWARLKDAFRKGRVHLARGLFPSALEA